MAFRGLEFKHEHGASQMARDTRPLGERAAEFLSDPATVLAITVSGAMSTIFIPATADIVALAALGLVAFAKFRKSALPFRLPKTAQGKDFNDLIPGTAKPKVGSGISFFGNDRVSGEELWFTNDDLRTHVLIFGSTGSGKTEALISIAYNSLIQGSGFIYIDGKGDNSLYAKIFSMVRSMGREDDLLVINFMTGARDIIGPQRTRLSNTMNPFSMGSSSMLAQLVVSMMDAGGGAQQGADMWKGRAISFIEALMKILTAMRDAGHILLDANSIRNYFILEKLEEMVVDKKFPVTDDYSVSLQGLPPQIMEPLNNYILNLPGYNKQKKGNQAGEVREQHGFITMQLTRIFSSLADTYGHIIRTNLPEVDFKDVVLNRRILVVLLPALEKSPEELSNLGKIIIASLKAMMAAGLGDEVEGDYRDVIGRKPTNSPSPYTCIMDEYGYYAVPGFAVVPAQARSLGFSAVFAGQDLPAFQKASKEEAASIGANCNIKICMKLEDPQETFEFFNKVAGETYVTNVSGFQLDGNSMSLNYLDTKNASVDRRSRIDLLDLRDQREGESHIFFKSKIVRAEMFYASPKPVKKMRLNHFLKVELASPEKLRNLDKRLKKFQELFNTPDPKLNMPSINEDIEILSQTFNEAKDLLPFERGIAALISLLENEVARQKETSEPYEQEGATAEMSAFTKVPINDLVKEMIGEENCELFSLPLLRRGSTLEEIKHIERLCGKTEAQAETAANDLVRDLENATRFPPEVNLNINPTDLFNDINVLIELFGGEPVTAEANESSQTSDDNPLDLELMEEAQFGLDEDLNLPDNLEWPSLPDLEEEGGEEEGGEEEGGEEEGGEEEGGEDPSADPENKPNKKPSDEEGEH